MNYNIRADIKPRRILNAGFKTARGLEAELGITFSDGGSASPPYLGEYTVTPTAREQTLNTKGFLMLNDVSILGIPFSVTENQSKGNTVFIG